MIFVRISSIWIWITAFGIGSHCAPVEYGKISTVLPPLILYDKKMNEYRPNVAPAVAYDEIISTVHPPIDLRHFQPVVVSPANPSIDTGVYVGPPMQKFEDQPHHVKYPFNEISLNNDYQRIQKDYQIFSTVHPPLILIGGNKAPHGIIPDSQVYELYTVHPPLNLIESKGNHNKAAPTINMWETVSTVHPPIYVYRNNEEQTVKNKNIQMSYLKDYNLHAHHTPNPNVEHYGVHPTIFIPDGTVLQNGVYNDGVTVTQTEPVYVLTFGDDTRYVVNKDAPKQSLPHSATTPYHKAEDGQSIFEDKDKAKEGNQEVLTKPEDASFVKQTIEFQNLDTWLSPDNENDITKNKGNTGIGKVQGKKEKSRNSKTTQKMGKLYNVLYNALQKKEETTQNIVEENTIENNNQNKDFKKQKEHEKDFSEKKHSSNLTNSENKANKKDNTISKADKDVRGPEQVPMKGKKVKKLKSKIKKEDAKLDKDELKSKAKEETIPRNESREGKSISDKSESYDVGLLDKASDSSGKKDGKVGNKEKNLAIQISDKLVSKVHKDRKIDNTSTQQSKQDTIGIEEKENVKKVSNEQNKKDEKKKDNVEKVSIKQNKKHKNVAKKKDNVDNVPITQNKQDKNMVENKENVEKPDKSSIERNNMSTKKMEKKRKKEGTSKKKTKKEKTKGKEKPLKEVKTKEKEKTLKEVKTKENKKPLKEEKTEEKEKSIQEVKTKEKEKTSQEVKTKEKGKSSNEVKTKEKEKTSKEVTTKEKEKRPKEEKTKKRGKPPKKVKKANEITNQDKDLKIQKEHEKDFSEKVHSSNTTNTKKKAIEKDHADESNPGNGKELNYSFEEVIHSSVNNDKGGINKKKDRNNSGINATNRNKPLGNEKLKDSFIEVFHSKGKSGREKFKEVVHSSSKTKSNSDIAKPKSANPKSEKSKGQLLEDVRAKSGKEEEIKKEESEKVETDETKRKVAETTKTKSSKPNSTKVKSIKPKSSQGLLNPYDERNKINRDYNNPALWGLTGTIMNNVLPVNGEMNKVKESNEFHPQNIIFNSPVVGGGSIKSSHQKSNRKTEKKKKVYYLGRDKLVVADAK